MLIKIWRRNCNSFNFSCSPALDQAAPWAVSLEGRRQINLVSINTTIGVLKGPAYGGHSLAHQFCSKNLYQTIKNVPCLGWILKPGQLSNSLCQEGTEDIFQSLVSIVMITIYVKTKRLKMPFLFGIGRRRLSLEGQMHMYAHTHRCCY